jgi:transposase
MRLHGNAELSLNKRRRLAIRVQEGGWTLAKAAEAAEVSVRTARKWVRRYRDEGEPGLLDRSSRPYSSPKRDARAARAADRAAAPLHEDDRRRDR